MARRKMNLPEEVVERNIALVGEIMRYLMKRPSVCSALPEDFELVILPDDDSEIRLYNLELLDKYGQAGKPVVFARIQSSHVSLSDRASPQLYVPVGA